MFHITRLHDIIWEDYNIISCKDADNIKHIYTTSTTINKYIDKITNTSTVLRRDLCNACRPAYETLMEHNISTVRYSDCEFIVYNDVILDYMDNTDDINYQWTIDEINTLNELLAENEINIQYDGQVVTITKEQYTSETEKGLIVTTLDFGGNVYSVYTGYATKINNVYTIPAISQVCEIKTSIKDMLSTGIISSVLTQSEREYSMLKTMIESSMYNDYCTADYIVNKLKQLKIKMVCNKDGTLNEIPGCDCWLCQKMITAINSTGETVKLLKKVQDISISSEYAITYWEFVALLSQMYYNNMYNIGIKELYSVVCELL